MTLGPVPTRWQLASLSVNLCAQCTEVQGGLPERELSSGQIGFSFFWKPWAGKWWPPWYESLLSYWCSALVLLWGGVSDIQAPQHPYACLFGFLANLKLIHSVLCTRKIFQSLLPGAPAEAPFQEHPKIQGPLLALLTLAVFRVTALPSSLSTFQRQTKPSHVWVIKICLLSWWACSRTGLRHQCPNINWP